MICKTVNINEFFNTANSKWTNLDILYINQGLSSGIQFIFFKLTFFIYAKSKEL